MVEFEGSSSSFELAQHAPSLHVWQCDHLVNETAKAEIDLASGAAENAMAKASSCRLLRRTTDLRSFRRHATAFPVTHALQRPNQRSAIEFAAWHTHLPHSPLC